MNHSNPPTLSTIVAYATGPQHYDLLSAEVVEQWEKVGNSGEKREQMTAHEVELSRRVQGCLEKLSICLLQCNRIKAFHDGLIDGARINEIDTFPENISQITWAQSGTVAIADFESLVLQSRACLDRLALYITSFGKDSASSYSTLVNVLRNSGRTPKYDEILKLHLTSTEFLTDLLITPKRGLKCLRDLIAHREAAIERVGSCFAINFLENRRALLFDCELMNYGVFDTTIKLGQHISYLVLNSLALFKSESLLPLKAYKLAWTNKFVVVRDFIVPESNDAQLLRYVKKMVPDGTVIDNQYVDPGIFEKAIPLS